MCVVQYFKNCRTSTFIQVKEFNLDSLEILVRKSTEVYLSM